MPIQLTTDIEAAVRAFEGAARVYVESARRISVEIERVFYDFPTVGLGPHIPTRLPDSPPEWELEFWSQSRQMNDWSLIPDPFTLYEVKRPDEPEEDMPMTKEMKLADLGKLIPTGIAGLHYMGGKPFNLVYKARNADDPGLAFLEERGWFQVRKQNGVYWSPANLEAYYALADSGLEYEVSANLNQWLKEITYIPVLTFPDTCPLKPWQRTGVEFLTPRSRAMLSLAPGLGKTVTSAYAAALQEDVRYVLLVCPASLLYFWKNELEKWSEHLARKPIPVVWHKETLAVEIEPDPDQQLWILTNPETLVKCLPTFKSMEEFDLLVVDESIMYKHRESQRAKAVLEMGKRIPKTWLLTGAPATRYLDDMWHQLHILDPRGRSSYWRWAKLYTIIEDTQWATTVVANKPGAAEVLKENLRDIYFSRTQEQVADIPDWIFEDLDLPMTDKQEAVYEKLRKELLIEIADVPDAEPLRVRSHIALMLRSLQVLSNPLLVGSVNTSGKWDALDELMHIFPGPFIVWVNFVRTGEIISEMLGKRFGLGRVALANGATLVEDRNLYVEKMQNGGLDAIVLNSTVGKFGFNLTRCRTAFFLERMYDDSYFQCIYRNRRIGTTESPIIVNMRSCTTKGYRTLDHTVHDTLDYRSGMIKTLTVGDIRRGLEG